MSSQSFPAEVDPRKWAEQGYSWSGLVPVTRFTRLDAAEQSAPLSVDAALSTTDTGVWWLSSTVRGAIEQTCQRCLNGVSVPVDISVGLALLTHEDQIDRLEESADYVLIGEETQLHGGTHDGWLNLLAVIEDELLLSLPLAPRHEICDAAVPLVTDDEQDDETPERENPFAALASLKLN